MKKYYRRLLLVILALVVISSGVFYAVRRSTAVDCQKVIAEFMDQSKSNPLNELTAEVGKCIEREKSLNSTSP